MYTAVCYALEEALRMVMVLRRPVAVETADGRQARGEIHDGGGVRSVILLLHGGAFSKGSSRSVEAWARHLSSRGHVVVALDYRLAGDSNPSYPGVLADIEAGARLIQELGQRQALDAPRLGVVGFSAGATLAALLVLRSAALRPMAAVVVSGIYDHIQQWEHDQLHRPLDQMLERFIGGTPMSARDKYYEASPIFHASSSRCADTKWLVAWGTDDDVVDSGRQSTVFVEHLKRAGAVVRTAPFVGAPHYWYLEGDPADATSFGGALASRMETFFTRWCGWPGDAQTGTPVR